MGVFHLIQAIFFFCSVFVRMFEQVLVIYAKKRCICVFFPLDPALKCK